MQCRYKTHSSWPEKYSSSQVNTSGIILTDTATTSSFMLTWTDCFSITILIFTENSWNRHNVTFVWLKVPNKCGERHLQATTSLQHNSADGFTQDRSEKLKICHKFLFCCLLLYNWRLVPSLTNPSVKEPLQTVWKRASKRLLDEPSVCKRLQQTNFNQSDQQSESSTSCAGRWIKLFVFFKLRNVLRLHFSPSSHLNHLTGRWLVWTFF